MCLQSHCGGLPRRHFNLGGAPDFIHVKFVLVAVGFDPSVVDDMFLAVDAVRVSALPYSSLRPTALYLLSGLQANNLRESSLQTEISEWAPKALTGPHGGSPSLQKVHAFVPERRTAFEAFCGSIRTERVDPDYLRSQIDSVRSNTRIGMKHRCAIELSQFSMQSNALSSAPALALSDGIVVNADTAEQQWTAPQRLQEQNIPILTVNKSRVVDPHKVYYLAKLGVAICICPKCGSTALFYFIYRVLIGQSWPYPKRSKPFVQNIMSRRWKGMWQALRPGDEQLLRYRIAFTRDPTRAARFCLPGQVCLQSKPEQTRTAASFYAGTARAGGAPSVFIISGVLAPRPVLHRAWQHKDEWHGVGKRIPMCEGSLKCAFGSTLLHGGIGSEASVHRKQGTSSQLHFWIPLQQPISRKHIATP